MLHSSQPVDWEIFSIPPVSQPVQYYSVLKKRREFSQNIKQYDPQVLKHGCLHYCGIVPKSLNSSLNKKYELLIIFFEDVPNTSFIGFRVKVSNETFIHESNSLLLFLKKSEKAGLYLLNDNSIHVQCGKNAWELFYLLYDVYLRQYVITVIGTQFFYHFVYSYCLQKEIQLYEMLFKGSKVIRVSKKSIYYRIHQKRKISVTDLIYMTLNLPDNNRYLLSFHSKESLSHTDFRRKKFYSSVENKVHVSNLVLKKFKKQFQETLNDKAYLNATKFKNITSSNPVFIPYSDSFTSKFKSHETDIKECHLSSDSTILKRKFEEMEKDGQEFQNSPHTAKFLKISDSMYLKEIKQWKQYKKIKPYTVESYSSILNLKGKLPKHFNDSKSAQDIFLNTNLLNNHSVPVQNNILLPFSLTQNHFDRDSLIVEETNQMLDHGNLYSSIKVDNDSKFTPVLLESISFNENKQLANVVNDPKYNTSESTIPNLEILCEVNCEFLSNQNDSTFKNNASSCVASLKSKNIYVPQKETFSDSDEIFTTAGGKTINISNNAMLSAQKFFQGVDNEEYQMLDKSVNSNPSKRKCFKNVTCSKSNIIYEKTSMGSLSDKSLYQASNSTKEIASDKIDEASFKNYECSKLDTDDIIFSTAAGKTLNISNTAMKTAQKLIHSTFKKEQTVTHSVPGISGIGKSIFKNTFRDVECVSNKITEDGINADMDKSLVEKFFEDAHFDEKEFKEVSKTEKSKDTDGLLEFKDDSNYPTRKSRKSLGGRRSIRFYSDKI